PARGCPARVRAPKRPMPTRRTGRPLPSRKGDGEVPGRAYVADKWSCGYGHGRTGAISAGTALRDFHADPALCAENARTGESDGLNYQRFYLGPMLSPARSSLLDTLVDRLAALPSIGRKSAQRLAYHVLASPLEDVEALSRALIEARRGVRPCAVCGNHAEEERCSVCLNPRREAALVCVVERPADVSAFEKLGAYRGLYHVL